MDWSTTSLFYCVYVSKLCLIGVNEFDDLQTYQVFRISRVHPHFAGVTRISWLSLSGN